MPQRLKFHMVGWLIVALTVLFGGAPAVADCDHMAMRTGARDCCIQAKAACHCAPGETASHASTASLQHGASALGTSCPCMAPAFPQDREPASTTTRVVVETASLPTILLPIPNVQQSTDVRVAPYCVPFYERYACPSPPRAPPFQG